MVLRRTWTKGERQLEESEVDADANGNLKIVCGMKGNDFAERVDIAFAAVGNDGISRVETKVGVIPPVVFGYDSDIEGKIIPFDQAAASRGAVFGKMDKSRTKFSEDSTSFETVSGLKSEESFRLAKIGRSLCAPGEVIEFRFEAEVVGEIIAKARANSGSALSNRLRQTQADELNSGFDARDTGLSLRV
jgi:hypothetical protein